jgi:tRNA A37 threonylcarbamoyladenosine dehydratase
VAGVGGVGSWCVEALARSGIGRLTLVDLDHVSESNINRQLPALLSTLGASKIEVMRARIADIAPECVVTLVDDFVTPDNAATLVPADAAIVDAIDQPRAKAALAALALARGRPVVICGAAGARTDPLRLRREDLALVRGDALLSAVRARLRREHGFPREAGVRFGVPAIYSDEAPGTLPWTTGAPGAGSPVEPVGVPGAPLACGGYGSSVAVTAAMGMAAASVILSALLQSQRD